VTDREIQEAIAAGYGTHLPMLKKACDCTTGHILECGTGKYSTKLLHEYTKGGKRWVVSLDGDAKWVTRGAQRYASSTHLFKMVNPTVGGVPDWNMIPEYRMEWGVVLVDQHPASGRLVTLSALVIFKSKAVVVVHDTEQWTYFYGPLLAQFKHRLDDDSRPRTTLLSNAEECPWTT